MTDLTTELNNAALAFDLAAERHTAAAAEARARAKRTRDMVAGRAGFATEVKVEHILQEAAEHDDYAARWKKRAAMARAGFLRLTKEETKDHEFMRQYQPLLARATKEGRARFDDPTDAEGPAMPYEQPRKAPHGPRNNERTDT